MFDSLLHLLPDWLKQQALLEPLIKIAIVLGAIQGAVAYLVLVERRVCAFMQDRLGPNRVGYAGLFQPIADGLKFIFKEELIPTGADKAVFLIAPMSILAAAMFAFVTVPFGYYLPIPGLAEPIQLTVAPGLDIGLLMVFAVNSLGVYGVILGGWASNNKYGFLGGLRSSAQLISYEIPLGLSVIGVLILSGSLRMEDIMVEQAKTGVWWIVLQPLGFIVFLTSGFAESAGLPFDLPECEQELVAGYHTEYTGMKFGMFALSEYCHMITVAFLAAILFFGGWHLWGIAPMAEAKEVTLLGGILRMGILTVKVLLLVFFFMWTRWSWPRFRYDQLMDIGWKIMIPAGLLNVAVTAACQEFLPESAWPVKAIVGWGTLYALVGYYAVAPVRPTTGARTVAAA